MGQSQLSSRPARSFLITLILSFCGFIGNYFSLPVTFDIAFIFGSIFSLVGVRLLGTWIGGSIALTASSYTYLLWNHPYGIVVFTLETIWVGLALQRGRTNILLIDATYWTILGIPQIILFYSVLMGLSDQYVQIIILKQIINGLLNALIAWIILSFLPLSGLLHTADERPRMTFEQVTFQVAAFFLMIPALGLLVLQGNREVNETQGLIINELQDEATKTSRLLGMWLSNRIDAVGAAAELGTQYSLRPSSGLQDKLKRIRQLYPDFHNVFIGDDQGTTVGFVPPVDEWGASNVGLDCKDREYFKELKETGKITISDVFPGNGDVPYPVINICVPVCKNGALSHFGVGTLNLERFGKILAAISHDGKINCTIVDRLNQVIVSTDPRKKPLEVNWAENGEREVSVANGVSLRRPDSERNVSIIQSWQGAYFHTSTSIPLTGWTLESDYALAPLQKSFYRSNITAMTVLVVFLAVMLVIAHVVSRMLGSSILSLTRVSKNLSERIEKGEDIDWPEYHFAEFGELIENFQEASGTLKESFALVREHKNLLEETVARRTQELIQLSKEQAVILDNANVGISMVKRRHQVWVNRKLCDLFGYTHAEMVNQPTRSLYCNEADYEQLGNEAYRVMAEDRSYQIEIQMRRKDGTDIQMRLSGKAIDPHMVDDGSIWILEDITRQKETELRLREKTAQLESLTKNLEDQVEMEIGLRLEGEKMLVQQSKLAAMGEMLGAISHQWRQPLNTLGLIIQNLREEYEYGSFDKTLLDDAVGESMDQIHHMSETIDDFRNFIKPEKVRSEFDLIVLMADCLRLLSSPMAKTNITVKLFCRSCGKEYDGIADILENERLNVNGYRNELQHVFLNILRNARDAVIDRKFTGIDEGEGYNPAILISFEHCRNLAVIEIEDNGGGIDLDNVERIFEPYFTTKQNHQGTGLGLYMSKLIVENMRGALTVRNGSDGAVFIVEIPVEIPDEMDASEAVG